MATKKAPAKVRGVYERDPGSGIWWIQYKQGKIRKREKVGRRSDAIALYQQRKTELRAGAKLVKNIRTREPEGVTFGKLADEALAWSESRNRKDIRTLTGRLGILKDPFGTMTASDLTPQRIEAWFNEHVDWAPATKNRYRAAISLAYKIGMRNGKVATNPARLVEPRAENNARVRYLQDDEEEALRKVVLERYPCHIPALVIALNTGMRLSEQHTLTWDQIDIKGRNIKLEDTKNGSDRDVPLNSDSIAALQELAKVDHVPRDRVFRSMRGKNIDNPRKWFGESMETAKIKGFRWHDLRHTYCSRLAMAGVDIRTIAALAGHKTLQMAMRYSHLAPSHNLSAVERISRLKA